MDLIFFLWSICTKDNSSVENSVVLGEKRPCTGGGGGGDQKTTNYNNFFLKPIFRPQVLACCQNIARFLNFF
jgi:hypothetical protein